MPAEIVVVGAGVIGLSSALELQSAGHSVTILAKDFPQPFGLIDAKTQINYTSPWGGAHNRWVPPSGVGPHDVRDHQFALATFQRMHALCGTNPEAGITFMKGVEYFEAPGLEYMALTKDGGEGCAKALGVRGFRVLEKRELPDQRVKLGIEYDTWCVNPMVYCSWLLNRFVYRGGKVVRAEVRTPGEVFEMGLGKVDVVVNASGQGFGDEKVFITRGQTCLIANTCDATVTRQNADGSWTFCVPRNFEGGTIIGGTKEVDNWDPNASLEVREKLIQNFVATYPSIVDESGSVTVLKDIVGRRPTRHGGARVEKEDVAQGKTVVHAYGLGGRGFEMSWGVAETVGRLVDEAGVLKARL